MKLGVEQATAPLNGRGMCSIARTKTIRLRFYDDDDDERHRFKFHKRTKTKRIKLNDLKRDQFALFGVLIMIIINYYVRHFWMRPQNGAAKKKEQITWATSIIFTSRDFSTAFRRPPYPHSTSRVSAVIALLHNVWNVDAVVAYAPKKKNES